jgi:hypothetical protein
MPILRGEDINIGVGMENPSARGTFVVPQAFIPGRTPSGISVEVTKALISETRGSGIQSQGSEIVKRMAGGPLEFNLRSESIGYLLKSLLGKCTTSPVTTGVKDHKFEVQTCDPQFPTISLALSQCGAFQDYGYKKALVKSLEIKTPVDDLVNATAEFVAADEEEKTAFDVEWQDSDYLFRPQDVSIKIADDVSGLAAAQAINVKEFSLKLNNNAKPQWHIGSVIPTDNIAGLIEIGGSITLDYEDSDYHDIYRDGEYRAIQITLERADIAIGTTYHPTITIILDKVSLEKLKADRPIDDVARETFDFVAHYDSAEEEAITVTVRNGVTDYNYDPIS